MLPVSIELSCKPFSCEVEATALENGSYLCRYTASQPGFYRLEATSKGVHLCGSPFSVQVSCSGHCMAQASDCVMTVMPWGTQYKLLHVLLHVSATCDTIINTLVLL